MLNSIPSVQGSDTTEDDSSTAAGLKIIKPAPELILSFCGDAPFNRRISIEHFRKVILYVNFPYSSNSGPPLVDDSLCDCEIPGVKREACSMKPSSLI